MKRLYYLFWVWAPQPRAGVMAVLVSSDIDQLTSLITLWGRG